MFHCFVGQKPSKKSIVKKLQKIALNKKFIYQFCLLTIVHIDAKHALEKQ